MNSIIERLLESWLDSQTERKYQPAFIQFLTSAGWNVLHNTRHSPIEFGKDVVARDPKGILYCFQLKGNPASRLTKAEAQSILPQILELIEVPLSATFKLKRGEKYKAVLVTNGEVDEEARLLLNSISKRTGKPGAAASDFLIWSRGTLLAGFNKTSGGVWPTSVSGARAVLDIISSDGKALPDIQKISMALREVAPSPTKKTSNSEKTAHLTGALLVAEILKSAWYQENNHYALYQITVLTCVYALQFADSKQRITLISKYSMSALEHCVALLDEARKQRFDADMAWAAHNHLSEWDIQWERRRLVGDCAASLILSDYPCDKFDEKYAKQILRSTFYKPRFWGYGAVPSAIHKFWAISKSHGGNDADLHLGRILTAALGATCSHAAKIQLASPYYSFEDTWAFNNQLNYFANESIFEDNFRNRAWFAIPILYMLAKRNYKQTCKSVWGLFSQASHEEPLLSENSFFTAAHAREGKMKTRTFHGMHWSELVNEAVKNKEGKFLDPYENFVWLIAAYLAIAPHRAWTGAIMWLDQQFGPHWYSEKNLP